MVVGERGIPISASSRIRDQEETEAILDRLREGEHSSAIRAHLRSLLRRGRSRRAAASRSIADAGEHEQAD